MSERSQSSSSSSPRSTRSTSSGLLNAWPPRFLSSLRPPREPGLIEHTTAVQAHFRKVFQVESPSGPGIRPGNVRVRSIGDQAALVTFEFERSGHSTGRRTIFSSME